VAPSPVSALSIFRSADVAVVPVTVILSGSSGFVKNVSSEPAFHPKVLLAHDL